MLDPKAQIQECRERLYAARTETTTHTLLMLCQLELAALDAKLRRCTRDELEKLQGEVTVWTKLQKYIQNDPRVGLDTN